MENVESTDIEDIEKPTGATGTNIGASSEVKNPESKKQTGIDIKVIAILIIGVLIIGVVIFMAFGNSGSGGSANLANQTANQTTGQTQNQANLTKKVLLETNMGNITIELYGDMPITAGNFEKLVKQGYYDRVIFHRVIDGFMIQGGDPTGTGRGGPGYTIKDEFTNHNKNDRGTISMANAGPNTGGSQFFINLVNNNYLDTKHPVFGKVVGGMDVVDKIGKVSTDSNNKPLNEVKIIKARVI